MATPVDGAFPLPLPEARVLERIRALGERERRALVRTAHREIRARELTYKGPQPLGLVPFVVEPRFKPALETVVRAVFRFQLRAPRLHKEDPKGFGSLMKLEGRTQAWFDRWMARPIGARELLIRPDFTFQVGQGGRARPVLLELNSCMLGGIYLHAESLETVAGTLLPSLGLPPRRLGLKGSQNLLEMVAAWLADGRRAAGFRQGGGIAFLESLPPGGGFSELPRITRWFQRRGVRALHGDPRELAERGGRVFLRGMPVDYVYRDFSFEDVGKPSSRRLKAFARLWDEGRVAPGFASDFDQKGILECFTSEAFARLFTRSEAAALRRHVPWTRVLTARRTDGPAGGAVDLPEFTRRNRERLVLKPSWESGGEGILLGPKTKPSAWEKTIQAAVEQPGAFAVQAYVGVPKRPTAFLREGVVRIEPCRFTLGVFHDGARFGFHARVSPKDIVNVAQGGAMSAVFLG